MRILVACEESQAVTKELRALGHVAYSCDLLPTSGSNPKWYADALANAKTAAERRTLRSKTFPGIAKQMAKQWGNL